MAKNTPNAKEAEKIGKDRKAYLGQAHVPKKRTVPRVAVDPNVLKKAEAAGKEYAKEAKGAKKTGETKAVSEAA